jgi:hypothetical protein
MNGRSFGNARREPVKCAKPLTAVGLITIALPFHQTGNDSGAGARFTNPNRPSFAAPRKAP